MVPPLVQQSIDSGRRAFDLTRLDPHRFGFGYTQPVMQGRKKIGFVLLAQDLDSKTTSLAEGLGGSVFVARRDSGAGGAIRFRLRPRIPQRAWWKVSRMSAIRRWRLRCSMRFRTARPVLPL